MATQPHELRSAPSQARKGNQNALRHGLYSQLEPPSDADLAAAAKSAAEEGDIAKLRAAARGYAARARELEQGGARVDGAKHRAAGRRLLTAARNAERRAIDTNADHVLASHRRSR